MSDAENLPAVVEEQEQQIEAARSMPSRQLAVLPSPDEWAGITTMARTICTTELVPSSYRGRPDAVIAAILMGREIGIGPMQSMRDITMIDGRPTLSAALMLSKMRSNGVVILDSKVDDERAWIRAQRTDTSEVAEVEWTYAEAAKIKRGAKMLVDGDGWKNYRQDMLWARCVGRLARRLGSDLLAGNLYSTEEVRDFDEPSTTTYDQATTGTSPYFNPEAELLPNAVKEAEGEKNVPALIMEQLNAVDPTVDWPATISDVIAAAYGVDSLKAVPEDRVRGFWVRLANAAAKAGENQQGDFPPVPTDEVIAAFVWAFGVETVELVVKGEVEQEPDVASEEEPAGENVVPSPDPEQLAKDAAATDFGEADK